MVVCCPESRFLRAAPRRVLRWRGARGALRPLFLLRSCAADQEKRPEKKSWAVMACAPVQLERLGDTCIRSAPRCISRGQREEGIFLRGRDFGDGFWELGLWKLCCAVGFCRSVAPKGGPVFRDRNGRCGLLYNSHLGGFAARCALRAALRRARGRPRSPNAGCTSTTFPPRLREPRPFFWAAFLSLRRLRCGKKSRGPGLLTAAFVQLEAASLEKIRVPGFFSGYFSLPAAIRRERKVPAAPRGSRANAASRAA